MKTLNDIAAAAYHAHGKELYRLIGVTQRPWVELAGSEAKCWMAAVQQVLAEASTMGVQIPVVSVRQSVMFEPLPEFDQATDAGLERESHALRT